MESVDYQDLVPFQLTICGIDELAGHCPGGVTHVLSILDPGWPEPEALSIFDVHQRLRLRFHDVIESQPGWIAPERWDVELLLAFARGLNASGETHLLIHCHAGVSRSTAAAALVLAQARADRGLGPTCASSSSATTSSAEAAKSSRPRGPITGAPSSASRGWPMR